MAADRQAGRREILKQCAALQAARWVALQRDVYKRQEQTRQIARRFNERYGRVFPEPHGLLTDAVEIPGLDGRKMSKSYGNAIALSATEEETAKLIKKSKTDSERMITFDKENRPGVSALSLIHI